VMSLVSSAGFRKVSLIAVPQKGAAARAASGAAPLDRSGQTVKH
jgi:hypothetical protein